VQQVLHYFQSHFSPLGMYANGSIATNTMDRWSDLDLTLVFEKEEALLACWNQRDSWELPILHSYEADHRKPFFKVMIMEGFIKTDVYITLPDRIFPFEKPPFVRLYDPTKALEKVLDYSWSYQAPSQELINQIAMEERKFWGWMIFDYHHFHRNDFYLLADDFYTFRKMLQAWLGVWAEGKVLTGREFHDHPSLQEWKMRFSRELYPSVSAASLRNSHMAAMEAALEIKELLQSNYPLIPWATTSSFQQATQALWKGLSC
jgi:hypothetical protein